VQRQAARELLRYTQRIPAPPPADPDLVKDATAFRDFVSPVGCAGEFGDDA
jgi:hypothetical protein